MAWHDASTLAVEFADPAASAVNLQAGKNSRALPGAPCRRALSRAEELTRQLWAGFGN
jgi:hypothetical protein